MRVAALILICASLARSAYLGLRNQGNTCYMNSLLQALHHLPEFRDAVFSIPRATLPQMARARALGAAACVLRAAERGGRGCGGGRHRTPHA